MALSVSQIKALYKTLNLPEPSAKRLAELEGKYDNLTSLRDALLSWGKNQGGSTYKQMIEGLVTKHLKGAQISAKQYASIVDQIVSGKATLQQKYDDIDKYIHGGAGGGGGGISPGPTTVAPAEEKKAKTGVGKDDGDPDTPDLSILKGEKMTWHFDPKSGKWYVEYGLPGSNRSLIFEATPEQMDQIFGEGRRPTGYERTTLKDLTARSGVTFAGDIAEMEGTGSFESHVQRVQALALDNGKLPDWAKDSSAAMDIIFVAQAEGKSDDWVVDQLAKLPEFKARFPGLEKFRKDNNLTMTEAIGGFLEYEASLKQAYKAAGLKASAVTPDLVGSMLERGHSIETVDRTVKEWKRMKQHKPALDAFNRILKAHGKAPLKNMQEYMDFVAGRASEDLYEIWEQSSLQEAAQAAGLGDIFTAADAIKASKGTEHTLESATAAMQQAAQLLLRMRGEVSTEAYGLTQDELIDLSLGVTPRSGRSAAEIQSAMNSAINTAKANMEQKAQPFTSFTQEGTPTSASLRNLRPGG